MKIKILKSGPWCLTGIGPTVHLKEGDIEPICKERIDIENAEKMIATGWAKELSQVEVAVNQKETTESQDTKINTNQSPPRRGRGRPARGRK